MQTEIIPIVERLKSPESVKWLFAGDSITHGALHTFGWRDYTELFSERIRFEMSRVNDFVIKSGLSGWTTNHMRENIDMNILQFNPHVVSIMIGMNDCHCDRDNLGKFYDNYNYILDRIAQNSKIHVMLHTTNPIWPQAIERASLPLYNDKIRQIASERKLPIIDHWSYWDNAIRENEFRAISWMNDSLHPGVYGHRAMARLLFKELDIYDTGYTSRLFVP